MNSKCLYPYCLVLVTILPHVNMFQFYLGSNVEGGAAMGECSRRNTAKIDEVFTSAGQEKDNSEKPPVYIFEEGVEKVMEQLAVKIKSGTLGDDTDGRKILHFENKEAFMREVKPNIVKKRPEKEEDKRPRVTDKVFFDLTIGGEAVGRLVIGVFGEIVPKTVKNFIELAKGTTTDEHGNVLHYKGSVFHRVMKYYLVWGGFMPGRPRGGQSIYGPKFDDENFKLKHYGSGWVSMANGGKNTNSCQFVITSSKHKYLDNRNVVFGKVLEGMELVRRIEFMETDAGDTPIPQVVMAETGVIPVDEPFPVDMTDVDPDVTERIQIGHDEL